MFAIFDGFGAVVFPSIATRCGFANSREQIMENRPAVNVDGGCLIARRLGL